MFIESNGRVLNLSLFHGWNWEIDNDPARSSIAVYDQLLRRSGAMIDYVGFRIDTDKIAAVNRALVSGEFVMCKEYCTLK
jgi:hypothetical protein